LSSSSPAAASEGALTNEFDNGAPITHSLDAASLSRPIDLGASISAADTPSAAKLGALLIRTTPEDVTEQSSPSKRRITDPAAPDAATATVERA